MKKSEILSIDRDDIRKLKTEEVRELVKAGSRIANLQIASLSRSKYSAVSTAFKKRKGTGYFTWKGIEDQVNGKYVISDKAARRRLYEVYDWLNLKSATVGGTKEIFEEIRARLGDTSEVSEKTFDRYSAFWNTYNLLKEYAGNAFVGDSDSVQRAIDVFTDNIIQSGEFWTLSPDEVYVRFRQFAKEKKYVFGNTYSYFMQDLETIQKGLTKKEEKQLEKEKNKFISKRSKLIW